MPQNAERAWESMLRIQATLLPRFDRVVQGAGLPMSWYDVLLELHTAGGVSTVTELGDRVVLSRSRVSRIVDELVAARLVDRAGNPDDRRSSIVSITDEGTARFRAAGRAYRAAIARELGDVDDATAAALERLLTAVTRPRP